MHPCRDINKNLQEVTQSEFTPLASLSNKIVSKAHEEKKKACKLKEKEFCLAVDQFDKSNDPSANSKGINVLSL